MTALSSSVTHELVLTACLAPSVHNTQPWSWAIPDATTVELFADRSRQLLRTDPDGRDLVMSCGAALHHLTVAAPAFGLDTHLTLSPDPARPDLLARVRLGPAPVTEEAVEQLAAVEDRMTDRRAFATWDVPHTRLEHLTEDARGWGAGVRILRHTTEVVQTENLLERARRAQLASVELAEEQGSWLDRGPVDGVPAQAALPRSGVGDPARPTRFDRWVRPPGPGPDRSGQQHPEGQLMVVFTARDDERAWLGSGMALSALWLAATRQGLAVAPQTHVIEDPRLRAQLRRQVFDDLGWPQVLLRVGWPQARLQPPPRTPRRPLAEVLRG